MLQEKGAVYYQQYVPFQIRNGFKNIYLNANFYGKKAYKMVGRGVGRGEEGSGVMPVPDERADERADEANDSGRTNHHSPAALSPTRHCHCPRHQVDKLIGGKPAPKSKRSKSSSKSKRK